MKTRYHTEAQLLADHLQCHAGNYFPAMAGKQVTVALARIHLRRYSRGYEFDLTGGAVRHGIFVKVPIATAAQQMLAQDTPATVADRPRLVPMLPIDQEAKYELDGLAAMGEHFATIDDRRIGAPRLLDTLPDGAIVVEAIRLPTLSQRMREVRRWKLQPGRTNLCEAFENTGRWLHAFHHMPSPTNAAERISTRDALLELFGEFGDYLGRTGVNGRFLHKLNAEVVRRAEQCLPATFELVLGHADFGLHNVFASAAGRAIGFDTLAFWRTSPLEDIAYFLTLLEYPPPLFLPRAIACRPRWIAELREAFLRGYFGEEQIPRAELQLYEILIAMEKWTSAVHGTRRAHGVAAWAKRGRLVVQQRMLRGRLGSKFAEPSSPATAASPTVQPRLRRPSWEQAS